jgi:hypothetical protein
MEIGTFEKHLLQQPKNPIATFEKHLLQYKKTHYNTGEKQQKRINNKRDGFKVQTVPAPNPITFEFTEGRREEYDPKLAGTLTTTTSLRSKGRGRGGGLRSREGLT